jgi:antitoxin component YwqK of YwqJK toxin-antitoxin module
MNGQLDIICNYINWKIEGECKIFYENGELKKVSYYVNEKKQ